VQRGTKQVSVNKVLPTVGDVARQVTASARARNMQLNQAIYSIYLLPDLAKWLWRYFDLKGG
jgi:hypothetical protein